MLAGRKIDAFALSPCERYLFAGNLSGRFMVIDPDTLEIRHELQATAGAIQTVACHDSLPLVAVLGLDRRVAVVRYDAETGEAALRYDFSVREIDCWNDVEPVPASYSLSQAIAFHPSEPRLAVRTGNNGCLEVELTPEGVSKCHCTRLHRGANIVTFRYTGQGTELLSAAGGELVLSRNGLRLKEWTLGEYNLHWLEPVGDRHYLIASDDLRVIRLNLLTDEIVYGDRATRDDLEHVTYNPVSGRAFIAGFDRYVYEVDPDSCQPIGTAWRAPFKMRWIKTLRRDPDVLIAQCFNGGLYRVDLTSGAVQRALKQTPPALWSGHVDGAAIELAGDPAAVSRLVRTGTEPDTLRPVFRRELLGTRPDAEAYVKRLWRGRGRRFLGQTDGRVLDATSTPFRVLAELGDAIRDIASDAEENWVFACTEDGRAVKLDARDGKVVAEWRSPSGEPLWSLAFTDAGNRLAVAERRGRLQILDGTDLRELTAWSTTSRPKRMRWLDGVKLAHVQTKTLNVFDYDHGESRIWVEDCGNTIEDFTWDPGRRYLAVIGYRTEIAVCDFASGRKLSVVPDQVDYTKGVVWVPPADGEDGHYPYDFMTFGRSGTAHLFRVHNERCVALGPVDGMVAEG